LDKKQETLSFPPRDFSRMAARAKLRHSGKTTNGKPLILFPLSDE